MQYFFVLDGTLGADYNLYHAPSAYFTEKQKTKKTFPSSQSHPQQYISFMNET